ncbi:ABC transporter permease [Oleiharenicola lentus]|uniref:ABC transporter permease n=1 Tax=Oleiharenicola lentus TaxID=2508720 RepID=UPI003F66B983
MYRLALKMLFGDHAKYLMLISGIMFSTMLMAQGSSLFCGIMSWTYATIRNARAEIWVADPKVERVDDAKPMRDTDVNRVRSVPNVAWAAPLYTSTIQARLPDGSFKLIQLVGIDATTFAGAPHVMLAGNLEDLRMPNTVIIDELGVQRLSEGRDKPVSLGDIFEINDREARIVGICKAARSFTGGPYVYTTYDRAVQYAPLQRKMLSFILAAPAAGQNASAVAAEITRTTGLKAFTEDEFMWSTMWWYIKNTGIPINVGTLVLLGFVVGTVISGQTFYSFVHENTRNLGALKAMGTSTGKLCGMLVLQSLAVGFIGYGIGLGLVAVLGNNLLKLGIVPFLMLWQVPAIVGIAVFAICVFSALLGIARIARLEPAIVFRG